MDDVTDLRDVATSGQARTRRARAAVLAAAHTKLVDDGYVATSIAGISAAAGVPATTVYRLFSTKLGILEAVIDVAIAGDDADVPVASRADVERALAESDPRARITGFVAVTTSINRRISAIYPVLMNAADADPDAAVFLDELTTQRQRGQGILANSLATTGSLRTTVDERHAADIIHTLMSPEVYRMLVLERRWPPERYADWLADTLADQLLIDTVTAG